MFENLHRYAGSVGATESLGANPATSDGPQLPPSRFGAMRIVLEPDPNQSRIVITEIPADYGYANYTVFINREIDENGNYYAELLTLLRALNENSQVTIYIGSPGGSLAAGAMIANAIKSSKAIITTVALGIVASAAALIWSYGHRRVVVPGAQVMFHMSSHGDWGNSVYIKQRADYTIRYVKEIAIDPLVEEGLLTPDEAEYIVDQRRDLWLDAATLNARLEAIRDKAV